MKTIQLQEKIDKEKRLIEEAKMHQKFAEDQLIEIDKTEQNKELELNKKQNEDTMTD